MSQQHISATTICLPECPLLQISVSIASQGLVTNQEVQIFGLL